MPCYALVMKSCIVVLLVVSAPAYSKPKSEKQAAIEARDKERLDAHNRLDDLKEGIWYVDKWKAYAKQICEDSNGFDCSNLGEIYHDRFYGYGSKADREKSVSVLRAACDLYDSASCLKLAVLAAKTDVPVTDSKELFIKSYDIAAQRCDGDYMFDCMTLALIYFEGYGSLDRDRGKAKESALKACDGGYASACLFISNNANSREEMMTSHAKACKLGIKSSC